MIDFHRLAHHSVTRSFWISKDLGQLLYSSRSKALTPATDCGSGTRIWATDDAPGGALDAPHCADARAKLQQA